MKMGSVVEIEEFDVVIIGAGLTGINAAYRLQTVLPDATFTILEGRDIIGGTSAFWKYPSARSDSSLAIFGLPWYPWPHDMDFAPAPLIRDYLEAAAVAEGIDRRVCFHHRVLSQSWSTPEQMWTLQVQIGDAMRPFKARWVISCAGYYDYDKPLDVTIPGIDRFGGEVVHPQFWKDNVAYEGKRVVVIGSGATAVTLLPALAEKAARVTMLQRSPSYVFSLPGKDTRTAFLKRWLPLKLASTIDWWRRMILESIFLVIMWSFPNYGRKLLRHEAKRRLPRDYPVDVRFNPSYPPFDQRLCLCPDDDFFKAIHRPNCEVVTDTINTVTETAIKLASGRELEVDMIITATGLHMQLNNGQASLVDSTPVHPGERYVWRSCMIEGVPNSCAIIGYTAGTWTPGADIHF